MKIEDFLSADEIALLGQRLKSLNLRRVKFASYGEFMYLEGWEPNIKRRVTASAHVPDGSIRAGYGMAVKVAVWQAFAAMKNELFGKT